MDYALLRLIHTGTVYITFGLFLTRGLWMLMDSPLLKARWIRVLPHLNDTLLLAAAIAMIVVGDLGLTENPWLIAKIAGLLAYIGLGTMALKRGKNKPRRVGFFLAALTVFGYIVAVAITKQVLPGAA